MNQIQELREKRAKAWDAAKAFLDTKRGTDGLLAAEDVATYEKMEADVVNLGKEIDRLERQAALDAELNKPTADPLTSKPAQPTAEQKTGRASDAYKKAFWNAIRSKNPRPEILNSLVEGTDSEGGYLVPDEFEKTLVQKLTAANVLRPLCHVIQTSFGDRKIPVVASKGTADWVDEEGTYPLSDDTFSQVVLGAYKVATMIKVSEELLSDSVFDIEGYVSEQFGKRIGDKEEDAFLLICETLFDNMDKILDAAFSIVKGLAEGIIRALPKLIEALPKLITGIINFITQNLPMLMTMGIQLTVQLALGLIKALPQLIAALPQIVSAILNGLGQSVSSMVEIGKNIVSGLWEGIKSMASWLASKVRDFFSGIVKSAKKALGIASPSKVFVGIGENMGDSVGVGFTGAMEDVNKQIQSAIPTSVDVGAIDVLTNLPNSIGIGGTSDLLSQKLDVLISEVRRYLPQLAGMQLVADTGATIGWLAPAMDDALGAIRRRKERLV